MKIGLIREGKVPPDKRVPLTPDQCVWIMENHPEVKIQVQSSDVRKFDDEAYRAAGVDVVDSLESCNIILGVKEVPIDMLIKEKTYFFFSHTIKEQPYNRDLLKSILKKNIRLVDYEVLTAPSGKRVIGFGRYAGIVGCYNGLRAFGLKSGRYELKAAHECEDRKEMEAELKKIKLPSNFKLVLSGLGRVGSGAVEVLQELGIRRVTPKQILEGKYYEPVWAQLSVSDYNKRVDGQPFTRREFYASPVGYESTFLRYAKRVDVYVAGHFWDARSPFIFTREDMRDPNWKISVVADISCDIDGPVACTLRPSTIADPIYGYDPETESEANFRSDGTIAVMAVDNLPCELPKDASEDFGQEFIKMVLPHILNGDKEHVVWRATITDSGKLTDRYGYLKDYVAG